MLYSLNGSHPTQLPHRIRLSDGKTRTNASTFTADELADAGWVAVSDPPDAIYPQKVEWSTDLREWVVRDPYNFEVAQKWFEIRQECVRKLAETDYKVIKSIETGVPVSAEMISYRQQLRDIYNNVNSIDPWNVAFPELPQTSEEQQ